MTPKPFTFSEHLRYRHHHPPTVLVDTLLEDATFCNDEEKQQHQVNNSTNSTTALTVSASASKEERSLWETLTEGLPPDAIIALNAVAILWGSQHPVIKMVVEDTDPAIFSLVRFFLGAAIASPAWIATSSNDDKASTTWRWGAEMGLWMFLGYAFQAIGLAYTTAQRSGFLLYLNVKFVPFFAFLLLGRKISLPTWISALTAIFGTALLAYDGDSLDFNTGDAWSVAAAAASAMFILRLEKASQEVPNSAALNAACLWVVTGAAFLWTIFTAQQHAAAAALVPSLGTGILNVIQNHPYELLYLSGVTTALANYIQTKAQKDVAAERASLIYAMDPVYGAVWSNWLLGETLTGLGVVGAGLITIAAATNAFLDLGSSSSSSAEEASLKKKDALN